MGKRGPQPRGGIDTTWRPELAYAVGLIASDGGLSKDGRHIDLTSRDRDQVRTFVTCLGLRGITVGRKRSGAGSNLYYRVQFGDIFFYRWLNSIGIHANKSMTISELRIPRAHFFDFLRGVWDGDGSIHAYWDPRWKSSYVFCLSFTSASEVFLVWIGSQIESHLQVSGRITRGTRAYQLKFSKAASKRVVHAMFPDHEVPHLRRKFAKVQKILRIDERHTARVP
ncbi:hypothetical protein GVX82_03885 [Patescibacteria group bacterium]|nr:hypothetical protein [Patescibacteria group bacterium]